MEYIGIFRTDPDHCLPVGKLKTKHYYIVYGTSYIGLCKFTEDYSMAPMCAYVNGKYENGICCRTLLGDNGMTDILSDFDVLFELSDEEVNTHIVMEII